MAEIDGRRTSGVQGVSAVEPLVVPIKMNHVNVWQNQLLDIANVIVILLMDVWRRLETDKTFLSFRRDLLAA